jgi:hypothetical protein
MKDGNLTILYTKETRSAQFLNEHCLLVLRTSASMSCSPGSVTWLQCPVTVSHADWFAS